MRWNKVEAHNYKQYMQKYAIHSLLAKVLASKQLTDDEIDDLLSTKLTYHDFSLFLEGEMAIDRIQEAIENHEKICIYGDYDCDGILATAILVQTFHMLGKKVGYHIPNRFEDGYGLNKNRVKQMAKKGYTLIITVDNGVKAYEAIQLANELGIDVIVTDHHEYDELPDAYAIVHTKMSPEYPFKEISGGFIAYKLASALLGKHDKYLFCLAAITTISDMMPLVDENRSLVKRALIFMKENKYLQLELLLGENQNYNVTNIGFIIAPKINSFGRLPEMVNPNHLVKFFLQGVDENYAIKISEAAKKINAKRQELTNKQYKNVITCKNHEDFLYVYDQDIHEGLVGLVAGKYTRAYQRPSFVMTYDEKNGFYRGSARSIAGIPLQHLFVSLQDDLIQYGGHALAGGFIVDKTNVQCLKNDIQNYLKNYDMSQEECIDVLALDVNDLSMTSLKELDMLEPLGNGNEETIFMLENILVENTRILSGGKHLRFDFHLPQCQMQALYFHCKDRIDQIQGKKTVTLIGKLKINKYLNNEYMNMIIEDMK